MVTTRTWREYLGDFSLRSPILGFGDLLYPMQRLYAAAKVGLWDIDVQLTSTGKETFILPDDIFVRHIHFQDAPVEWTNSVILTCASGLVGIWDNSQWSAELREMGVLDERSIAAAALMASYGVKMKCRPTTVAVLTAEIDGITVAGRIITKQEEQVEKE